MPLDGVARPPLVDAVTLPNGDARLGAEVHEIAPDQNLEPCQCLRTVHRLLGFREKSVLPLRGAR